MHVLKFSGTGLTIGTGLLFRDGQQLQRRSLKFLTSSITSVKFKNLIGAMKNFFLVLKLSNTFESFWELPVRWMSVRSLWDFQGSCANFGKFPNSSNEQFQRSTWEACRTFENCGNLPKSSDISKSWKNSEWFSIFSKSLKNFQDFRRDMHVASHQHRLTWKLFCRHTRPAFHGGWLTSSCRGNPR